jgi:hypothetical protein
MYIAVVATGPTINPKIPPANPFVAFMYFSLA